MRIAILGRADYLLLQERIKQLAALNQEVHLITIQQGAPEGCTVHRVPDLRAFGPLRYIMALAQIRRQLQAIQPDVIDVHGLSSYGAYGLAPLQHIPFIATMYGPDVNVHGAESKFVAWVERRCLARANRVYSSAPVAKNDIHRVLNIDIEEKFMARSWGITVEPIMAQSAERRRLIRQELNVHEERRVILHNRQFTDFWHVKTIIESIPQVVAAYPNTEYWFVYPPLNPEGQAALQDAQQKVAAMAMTAHVRFLGPQPYDRMITMMHAADIYLCLGKSDMLASSLLEALCTELVPVLHNLPAYQEVVKDRVNGILLNKLDQQSITNALTDVLHNYQELRKQYGEKNRLLIKQNYDSRQNTAWLVNQLAAIAAIPAHELNLPLSRSLS